MFIFCKKSTEYQRLNVKLHATLYFTGRHMRLCCVGLHSNSVRPLYDGLRKANKRTRNAVYHYLKENKINKKESTTGIFLY